MAQEKKIYSVDVSLESTGLMLIEAASEAEAIAFAQKLLDTGRAHIDLDTGGGAAKAEHASEYPHWDNREHSQAAFNTGELNEIEQEELEEAEAYKTK